MRLSELFIILLLVLLSLTQIAQTEILAQRLEKIQLESSITAAKASEIAGTAKCISDIFVGPFAPDAE